MTDPTERLVKLRDAHRRRREEFETVYQEALDKLLATVLPSLERVKVELIARVSGVEGLHSKAQADTERKACLAEIERIEADPAYQNQTAGLRPDNEDIGSTIAQLTEHRDTLQAMLKICLEHPRFFALLESGYGTQAYDTPMWRLSYHLDRKTAQEIEEQCHHKPWQKIREEVVSAIEASTILERRIKSLRQSAKEVKSLAKRRAELIGRLKRLDEIMLATGRWKLRRAFETDADTMCRRLGQVECWREVALYWRIRRELWLEHKSLLTDYLVPAQEALALHDWKEARRLLDRFEELETKLLSYEANTRNQTRVDWKTLFYGTEATALE